jgi:hypothetical protein
MLYKKLRIREGAKIVALNAPENYEEQLGILPDNITIQYKLAPSNEFIHLFVQNKADLEKGLFKAIGTLVDGGLIWISYPKQSSGMQTDLTRDKGWECLDALNMQWLSLISFDEHWSAFLMRKSPPLKPKIQQGTSEQMSYIDAQSKTVIIPEDLAAAFQQNKNAQKNYDSLAYSHRKEYVLWIVGAKKNETRATRVSKTIEMLLAGKKNPTDK